MVQIMDVEMAGLFWRVVAMDGIFEMQDRRIEPAVFVTVVKYVAMNAATIV